MTETKSGSPVRDPEFVALAGTAFARSQAYSTILIALALYADLYGTTGVVEGLFGTAFAIVQLIIVLPLGRFVDTHDAKRVLLVGLAINVAVFVGFLFVRNPVHVILVRMLQGVGASILWITGAAVIGEISEKSAQGRWLGTYNQVGAFSSFAGDLVGGTLLAVTGFTGTYLLLSAITLLAFVLVYALLRENPGGRTDPDEQSGMETLVSLMGRVTVRSLVVFRLAFSVGKMAVILFLPIFARTRFGIGPLAIGGILAGGKLTKALLQGKMGELTDAWGHERHFVLVGALVFAVGTALIPFAEPAAGAITPVGVALAGHAATITGPMIVLFAAYGIIGVADSIRLPASMSLFVTEGERFDSVASSMSLRSISWKVGQVAGPVLVGTIKDVVGVAEAFWTAAGFILVASGLFVGANRAGRDESADALADPGD
ncbi:MAG: MFS transporter [Halanaeroarchaeum sp.]